MKVFRISGVFLFTVIMGLTGSAGAQQFDYEKYPRLDFSFSHLDLSLSINPDDFYVEGTAAYEITANIAGVDSLILQAAHMEINSVSVDDQKTKFNLQNDSLFIALSDSSRTGQTYTVSIDYNTIPRFGLLKNDRGTIWTSLLPRSHRHWFPVVDHPRVTFNSTINLTVPSDYQAVATGLKMGEEIVDVEHIRYTYKTRRPVPASLLSFTAGQFEIDETSLGIKKIMLHAEKGLLKEAEQKKLLEHAYQVLKETEKRLEFEFPYERLHVIVLEDHSWETKTWGASTIFIFKNRGSWSAQLRRGIYAQWFGVYQREEQWSDASVITLLQTALHYQLSDEPVKMVSEDDPAKADSSLYDAFGPAMWNAFQRQFDELDVYFRETVNGSFSDLLAWNGGVYTFRDYGSFWYQQNGQPVFELHMTGDDSVGVPKADSVVYRVDYTFNESDGRLKLTFQAKKGVYKELVTLPLVEIAYGKVDTSEVTFTGSSDSVMVQVPPLVENVKILTSGKENLVLDEYKPAPFLLYELRRASTIDERVEAARKLGHHSDNPDLQLAIKDFMNREMRPRVKAALLKSLGDITAGASGMEQVFLDALDDTNNVVQEAGLMVLQNYPDNEAVQEAVREYALKSDQLSTFKRAALVLSGIAEPAMFEDFVSTVVKTDTAGHKAIFGIQELANSGEVDRAVKLAEFYVSDVYDYSVRSAALHILFQHDHTPARWETRAKELLANTDPRIRFLTVKGLKKVNGLDYKELLKPMLQDEYDQRVFRAMLEVMSRK